MTREGYPLPEPHRRYWRRRVNRHVRKARRTRTLLRWTGILAANLAAAGLLVAFGASVARHFATSSELAVREIVVEGTRHTTPHAVRAVLGEYLGRNLVQLDLAEVARAASRDAWVKEAVVKRVLPSTLRVSVTERSPAALALLSGLVHVIDDRGAVMGPVGPELPYDFPLLIGLDQAQGRDLATALTSGVQVLADLHAAQPAWAKGIAELDLSRPDRVVVTRVNGGAHILLDPAQIDRNLDAYIALQPTIARKVGEGGRVDLRWTRRISILPAGDPTDMEKE